MAYFPEERGPVDFSTVFNNTTPTLTINEPPDDRYLPGYTQVEADGDKKVVGPRLKDLNVPFSLYGLPIPITFGVRRLYGNIIWAVPLRESVRKKKSGGGKGGGGPDKKSTTYSYFATFAVSFGVPGLPDMAHRDIIRIWANGTLIYDRRGTGRTKISALHYNFYKGTPDQEPDPIIESFEGEGNVPAYRDLMYLVIHELPVEEFGNMPPAISVEIGDDTTRTFKVENIATPTFDGTKSTNGLLADFETQIAFMLRRTNGSTAVVRSYNLLSNSYMGTARVNVDGAGWSENTEDATISNYSKGIGTATTYIPWLGMMAVQGFGSGGGKPILLVDPFSGATIDWCGSNKTTSNFEYQIESIPEFASTGAMVSPSKGVIPVLSRLVPFKAIGLYGTTTFLLGCGPPFPYQNALLMYSVDNPLHVMAKLTAGNVVAACPGEEGIGTGSVYMAVGSTVRKVVCQWNAVLLGGQPIGVEEDLTWKTGFTGTIRNMIYYPPDNSLIVFTSGRAYKIDCATKETIWEKTGLSATPGQTNEPHMWMSDISGGTIAWSEVDGDINEFDVVFGTLRRFTEGEGAFATTGVDLFDSTSRSVLLRSDTGNASPDPTQEGLTDACTQVFYDRISDDRMLLADFILGMAVIAGYDESDIEIDSSIDDEIDGAIIGNSVSFRAVIDSIMAIYRIDVIESGGKIKFTRASIGGGAVDFTAVEDDLLTTENAAPETATFQFRREEEVRIPQRVQLRYIDKSLGYQIAMQMATRSQVIETNTSQEQITYEVPIIMTATEAKTLVNRALWNAWTSRVSYSFRLGPEYLDVEPGDIGQVTADNVQYKIRCVELSYNFDKSITFKGQNFLTDEAIVVVGDPGDGYEYELPAYAGTEIFVLDLPLLMGSHDLSFTNNNYPMYFYVGPKLLESSWAGGTGYLSRDFINFNEMGSNISQGLTAMVATVPGIPDNIFETDNTNTITVFPRSGDKDLLVTATELEVLNGANVAAYGRNGRWEVVQFTTVTDNGDGTFTLSGLLRGRRGSDKQVDLHQPGDYFVLLDEDYVDLTTMFFADLDHAVDFKGVGFGQAIDAVIANRVTVVGYGGLPWPVGNEDMERTIGGDGDITLTWNRRSRTSGELTDGIENAPLTSYEVNDYKITIWRWPHYNYTWSGTEWVATLNSTDSVEILVTDAETFALSDTLIRTHQLYEYLAPDDPFDEGTTFSPVSCDTIPANAATNLIAADLGYDEWHAFIYLDVMIQQKTNMPNSSGYGPGRRVRVEIRDDV